MTELAPDRFINPMSKSSALLSLIAAAVLYSVILHPTFFEFGFAMFIETVMLAVVVKLQVPIYLHLYPLHKLIFPKIQFEKIAKLDEEGKKLLFDELLKFPQIRATFFFVGTFIKMIPASLFIIFYWQHQVTNFEQFMKLLFIQLLLQTYLYATYYLEAHGAVSQTIAEFHNLYDWTNVFLKASFKKSNSSFLVNENLSLVATIVMVLALQSTAVFFNPIDDRAYLAIQLLSAGCMGMMMFSRIWYVSRHHFIGALGDLFDKFETMDYGSKQVIIPPHSSPLLARFENTFNLLSTRLKASEHELAEWTMIESEQSRYRTIGEFSALVAHDLMTPLHTAQFCVDELAQNSKIADNPKYLEQLKTNTDRAVDLVRSLRAYLRNPSSQNATIPFGEAHLYVDRLLKTQFRDQGYHRLAIIFDVKLENIVFQISQVDLIHVLYNIYKNSVENVLNNDIEMPTINISLLTSARETATFRIIDNGTGLTANSFEELTAYQFIPKSRDTFRQGLGLRLTRRLVENRKGTLRVIDGASQGTTFELCLPLENQINKENNEITSGFDGQSNMDSRG